MKILVFGGSGLVGSRFVELFSNKFEIISPSHDQIDLTRSDQLAKFIYDSYPDYILYAAGFTNVDLAQENKQLCFALNVTAPKNIASEGFKLGIPFCYLSTDYVFDGQKIDAPYTENDEARPLDAVYAKSKRSGEIAVLESGVQNLIVRLIMPFSAVFTKKLDLVRLVLTKLGANETLSGIVDQKINPIYVDDLVNGIALLLENKKSGIYHLGATDYTNTYELMVKIARTFNLNERLIGKVTFEDFSKTRSAKRPQYSWLDTSKFVSEFGEGVLYSIDDELAKFHKQFQELTD